MRARFREDKERTKKYGVKPKLEYEIEFRSDTNIVFVDIYTVRSVFVASIVHPSMQDFLESWDFSVKVKSKRVRRNTDFKTTRFFSTGEAAELLGVSSHTIHNWIAQGRLKPHHQVGTRKMNRFAREDVFALWAVKEDNFEIYE